MAHNRSSGVIGAAVTRIGNPPASDEWDSRRTGSDESPTRRKSRGTGAVPGASRTAARVTPRSGWHSSDTREACRPSRPPGHCIPAAGSSSWAGEESPLASGTLRSRSLQVLGYTNNARTVEQRRDALVRIVDEAVAGRLSVTHTRAPLGAVTEVWDTPGRVVLEI